MNTVLFDYSKLRGRIVEKYGTIKVFADAIKMNVSTVSQLLNNHRVLDQKHIVTMAKALDINADEIPMYFFASVVQSD